MKPTSWLLFFGAFLFIGCSPYKQISKAAQQTVIQSKALQTAHVGISIFEPATGKYWYNYQGDKYFVPASNTKIPTTYVGMKYLGDSLPGLRYHWQDSELIIIGTGDPTFLHPDFKRQPVFDFLKQAAQISYVDDEFLGRINPLGNGWAWNDYAEAYAPERSEFPMYGNVVHFYMQSDTLAAVPKFFYNSNIQWKNGVLRNGVAPFFTIERPMDNNAFYPLNSPSAFAGKTKFTSQRVPFKTNPVPMGAFKDRTFINLLKDTLHKEIVISAPLHSRFRPDNILHSQPTDSMLKPLMHRSDNFFAEQTLLMVSNELLGVMNEAKLIDTILKTDFKDLPQMPRWADGSGLSRYNLFTPQSFVAILDKMKREFGMERIKEIFPSGNDGTLRNYYVSDSAYIWAKTGTLSGVVALSGYLITQKNKLLLFSVLVNNHRASSVDVRRAVEQFLVGVRERY